jgi:hypothetical protein
MNFENTLTLRAPAHVAWQVIGERFGDLSWTQSITHVDLDLGMGDVLQEGAKRVCTSSRSFGPFAPPVLHEQLLHLDRDAMQLTYAAVEGLPSMMKEARNAWTVVPLSDDTCRVESRVTTKMAWWARPLSGLLAQAVNKDLQGARTCKDAAPVRRTDRKTQNHPRRRTPPLRYWLGSSLFAQAQI